MYQHCSPHESDFSQPCIVAIPQKSAQLGYARQRLDERWVEGAGAVRWNEVGEAGETRALGSLLRCKAIDLMLQHAAATLEEVGHDGVVVGLQQARQHLGGIVRLIAKGKHLDRHTKRLVVHLEQDWLYK